MRTIAPDAYEALFAVASAALDPVVVVRGQLGTRVEAEYLQLTDVASAKEWAGMGARGNSPQWDAVAVSGIVWASGGADADADRMHRAYELLGKLEDAVAADVTLGNPRIYDSIVVSSTCTHGPTQNGGRAASLEFSLVVRAYLS